MKKSTILSLMAGIALAPLTAETADAHVATLQKQVESLQKQLESLAKQVKEQKTHASNANQPQAVVLASVIEEVNVNETPVFEKGYIAIPGTTAGVKIGGMVKMDMIRDTKAYTGEQTNVSRMPYALQMRNPNLPGVPTKWKNHFYMHAKQSKIGAEVLVKNKAGSDVKAFIEGDFFGNPQWGDNFPNSPSSGTQFSNNYTFRLRHAVLSYGGLEAGHTSTTFHTTETQLPSVDLNGLTDACGRHALIRYTHKLGNIDLTAAAENARGDYATYITTPNGTSPNYSYVNQDSSGNLSKPARPDFVVRAKYHFDNGSVIGLSYLNRDLQIKNNTALSSSNAGAAAATAAVDGRTYNATGWGLNLAAKIMTFGQSFITTGITTGRGIGWYILEAQGRSALFNPVAANDGLRYRSIPMTMVWAGYSHVWNPQWKTNFGFARIQFSTQKLSNELKVNQWFDPGLDKVFHKFLVNTMYSPIENLQLGLEYYLLKRKSTLNYRGFGQRLQFGASYKF